MEIKEEKTSDFYILSPVGRLDANTSPDLETKLMGIIDDGEKDIVINFEEIDYISSSGLRVLLMGAKRVNLFQKKIELKALTVPIKEVFDIAGFTPLFVIS